MTSPEGKMLTMRIIKLLGIAGVAVLAAAYLAAREQRREEEERRRLDERLEKERWESEGGASRSGPATPERRHRALTQLTNEGRIRGYRSAPVYSARSVQRGGPSGDRAPARPAPCSIIITVLRGCWMAWWSKACLSRSRNSRLTLACSSACTFMRARSVMPRGVPGLDAGDVQVVEDLGAEQRRARAAARRCPASPA